MVHSFQSNQGIKRQPYYIEIMQLLSDPSLFLPVTIFQLDHCYGKSEEKLMAELNRCLSRKLMPKTIYSYLQKHTEVSAHQPIFSIDT